MTKPYNVIKFASLDSTNSYAIKNIGRLDDRDIIVADIQTAGRGRFDRKWISDVPDNIYMSFVLKPQGDYTKLPLSNYTHYLAVVLAETLKSYGVNALIKWPNDVKVDGKKISGILSQTSFTNMSFNGIVVGVGINLNQKQSDIAAVSQPATSLNLILGRHINNEDFMYKLLDGFFARYDEFVEKGFAFIRQSYLSKCMSLGKEMTVHTVSGDIAGIAVDIDNDGRLRLDTPTGLVTLTEGD